MTNEEKLAQLKEELRYWQDYLVQISDSPSYEKRPFRNKVRSVQSHIARVEIAMGIRPKPEPKQPKITFEEWLAKREAASAVTETASQERN